MREERKQAVLQSKSDHVTWTAYRVVFVYGRFSQCRLFVWNPFLFDQRNINTTGYLKQPFYWKNLTFKETRVSNQPIDKAVVKG